MGIFSRLFGRGSPEVKDPATAALGSPAGAAWYFAEDKSRGLRQIVITIGKNPPSASRFGSLALNPQKYAPLLDSDVAVGFFASDSDPGPFLMIKTPNLAEKLSREPLNLAFSFCHMPSGPLFAIFGQSRSLEELFRKKGGCFIDQVYSVTDFKDLITAAFKRSHLHIVFAQSGGMFGIQCVADAQYPLERALSRKFSDEWLSLVAHGRGRRPSFEASREELYSKTPVSRSPIIAR